MSRPVGITAQGNAQVSTSQSKFGGASALFDGAGDYLEIADDEKWDLTQNEWTFEGWFRVTTVTSAFKAIASKREGATGWMIHTSNDDLFFNFIDNSDQIVATAAIATNTWYHFAVTKNSTTYELFLNGTSVGTLTRGNITTNSNPMLIGRDSTNTPRDWTGNIDEVRISNIARYTADFTPPQAPHTNDDNTLLLLHMDGTNGSTVFEDDNTSITRDKQEIEPISSAQVSTSFAKFGTGSLTDGNLSTTFPYDTFGVNDEWTIEGWVNTKFANLNGYKSVVGFPQGSASIRGWGGTTGVIEYNINDINGSSRINWNGSGITFDQEWNHWAIVRRKDTNTVQIYINGVLRSSRGPYSAHYNLFGTTQTQGNFQVRSTSSYVDEFRLSKTARYRANFTPQIAPFVNDEDTLLLLHMDGTDGSTTFIDDNGVPEVPGEVKEFEATLSVSATASADAKRARSTQVNLNTSVSTNITSGRIRSAQAQIVSAFSPSIRVEAQRTVETVMSVRLTMSAESARTRSTDVALVNIVNLNIQAARRVGFASAPFAQFTSAIDAQRIRTASSQTTSKFTLSNQVDYFKGTSASLDVSSQFTVSSIILKRTSALMSMSASVSATANITKQAQAELITSFELFTGTSNPVFLGKLRLASSTSLSVEASITKQANAQLETLATLQASAIKPVSLDAVDLGNAVTLNCRAGYLRAVGAGLVAQSNMLVVTRKLVSGTAVLDALTIQTTNAVKTVQPTIALNTDCEMFVLAGAQIQARVNTSAVFSIDASIRNLIIDDIVYVIPRENRQFTIDYENR